MKHTRTVPSLIAAVAVGVGLFAGTPVASSAPNRCGIDAGVLESKQRSYTVRCHNVTNADRFAWNNPRVNVLPKHRWTKAFGHDTKVCQQRFTARGDLIRCVFHRGHSVVVTLSRKR